MITSVGIKNLRSLKQIKEIEIKPITILVGANSSGKSTFLRSFPLFTQSIMKSLRGSVSWFDDALVDFGDYDTAINRYALNDEHIQFFYHIEDVPYLRWFMHSYNWRRMQAMGKDSLLDEVDVGISLADDNKGTYINYVFLKIKDFTVSFGVDSRTDKVSFLVNNEFVGGMGLAVFHYTFQQTMLPSVVMYSSKDEEEDEDWYLYNFKNDIIRYVLRLNNDRVKTKGRVEFIFGLWEPDKLSFLNKLLKQTQIPVSLMKLFKSWDSNNQDFIQLYNLLAVYHVLRVYPSINRELSSFYSQCSYIAPARAEASRYYRTQGLQVDDIDAYGRNLAEFISSLTPTALQSYGNYTDKLLGVRVKKENSPGHQSIVLVSDNGKFNISDVGFGYSQILPIVTKLWFYSYRPNRRSSYPLPLETGRVVLIEQPELHLHPAYQAKLADAFVEFVNLDKNLEDRYHDYSERNKQKLIFETHSETIINRIGKRIREGKLKAEDVNVVIFEKKVQEPNTTVRQTGFDERGQLKDWPIGFFEPED